MKQNVENKPAWCRIRLHFNAWKWAVNCRHSALCDCGPRN